MKEPKKFVYALKILFKNSEGKFFGPSIKYEYELNKWHKSEDTPSICNSGFHVPTLYDIKGGIDGDECTYLDYYKAERLGGQTMVVCVVKLAGKFDIYVKDEHDGPDDDCDKLSASKICVEYEVDVNTNSEMVDAAKLLKKKYKNCIYRKNYRKLFKVDDEGISKIKG